MPLSDWPYERGRSYNRKAHIHARYDGQQQGGIITPAGHPLVIAITGAEGEQHGYSDCLRPDGIFEYFGEGQIGDMLMVRGNKAIASHADDGKSLLLFGKERNGKLRFDGEWICEKVVERVAPDRSRQMRRAFVFELRSLDAVKAEAARDEQHEFETPLVLLRAAALKASKISMSTGTVMRTVYERSADVRRYVLARAGGHCEGCSAAAPFCTPSGAPYLEPHHTRRVSDGGPDDPRYVIALCPNCHRRVHAGMDGEIYNKTLMDRLRTLEP